MICYSLPPDGPRAEALDRRMRATLADSLAYISGEIAGLVPFDAAALTTLIQGLRDGRRYPPSTFALYADLVPTLESGDLQEAETLLAALAVESPMSTLEVYALDDPALAARAARYCRYMDSDPTASFSMLAPDPAVAAAFRERFKRSYQLLNQAAPELAGEFDALVSQVIMVAADTSADYQFDGGSSYMLWGALFLNAESHDNDIAMVEVLAHESAHMLLFGYACDEALVNNDDETLYESPLRVDARPMDGIYHATYVSARMHWAMARLLASGLLDEQGRAIAEQALVADRENFEAGYGVVAAHGDLTATGRAVMAAARAYMDSLN